MQFIYEDYNVGYNIVSDILGFNSQIRFKNIPDRYCQCVRLYRSRRTGLYKEPIEFPGFKDSLQVQ